MPVVAGLVVGAVAGSFLALVYGAIHFMTGGVPDANGTTIPLLPALATYVGTGALAGTIVSTGRHLLRWRAGAAFVVSVALVPAFLGFGVLFQGSLATVSWIAIVAGSVAVGIPLGILIRSDLVSRSWITRADDADPGV